MEIGAVQARALVTGDERYVTYHRAESFSGKATIAYTVSDGHHDFTGTITLTVEARNHAPVTVHDFGETSAGQTVSYNVVANDADSDGDDIRLLSATAASGDVAVREGKVVYTPRRGGRRRRRVRRHLRGHRRREAVRGHAHGQDHRRSADQPAAGHQP